MGRPGCDLAYVARGLEETERRAWYMRREGEHFLFRTRASVNKRFQERQTEVQPGEIRDARYLGYRKSTRGSVPFRSSPFRKIIRPSRTHQSGCAWSWCTTIKNAGRWEAVIGST